MSAATGRVSVENLGIVAESKVASRRPPAKKTPAKHVRVHDMRDVPRLSDTEKAFHRGIAEAGDALSIEAVSASFLKRYGTLK